MGCGRGSNWHEMTARWGDTVRLRHFAAGGEISDCPQRAVISPGAGGVSHYENDLDFLLGPALSLRLDVPAQLS